MGTEGAGASLGNLCTVQGLCARRESKYTTSNEGVSSLSSGLCFLKNSPRMSEFTPVSDRNMVAFSLLRLVLAPFHLKSVFPGSRCWQKRSWDVPGEVAHLLGTDLSQRMEKKQVQKEGKVECNGGRTGPQLS